MNIYKIVKYDDIKNKSKNSSIRDDTFRTLMNNCIKNLIPEIGKISWKNYTGDEKFIQHQNEYFINQQDRKSRVSNKACKLKLKPLKIRDYSHLHKKSDTLRKSDILIIDTLFSIIDNDGNETFFIIEARSTPYNKPYNKMIIRVFECAADASIFEHNNLTVIIPYALVTYGNTPDEIEITEVKKIRYLVELSTPLQESNRQKSKLLDLFDRINLIIAVLLLIVNIFVAVIYW